MTAPAHANPQSPDAAPGRMPVRSLPMIVPDRFVADILGPYRPNAKYLRSAEITQLRGEDGSPGRRVPILTAAGRFAIPESCYIDDTGHFNAVEFNICYNQLAYVMFGTCFETGVVDKLRFLTPVEYRRHQLQSCFIVSIESRFLKQLKGADFRGELVLNKLSWVGGVLFCFTAITFSDSEGVKAQGSVVLAFNPPPSSARH